MRHSPVLLPLRLRVVGHWLYPYVVGSAGDPPGPGYRRITSQPQAGGGLTQAGARYDSLRESITSE